MSLLKFLPPGTNLKLHGKDCRYIQWFEVSLGGYEVIEVAKFIYEGKDIYFGVEICDSQFSLSELLDECSSQPFASLREDMKAFITSHFNNLKGGAA